MKSSARPSKERETETFYPLTRDQLRVSGIPVIRIHGCEGSTATADENEIVPETVERATTEMTSSSADSQKMEKLANKWENENWVQISTDVLGTNLPGSVKEKSSEKLPKSEDDSKRGSDLVPRYQGNDDPESWSKKAFRSKPKLPTEQQPESFLDQLSKAEFVKPGERLTNSASSAKKHAPENSRYHPTVPKPHFGSAKPDVANQVVFVGPETTPAPDPAHQNFRSIKQRLERAHQPTEQQRQQPDVQFPSSGNPSSQSTETNSGKKLPFWTDAGIQVALGLAFVLGVFGIYSFITKPGPQNNSIVTGQQIPAMGDSLANGPGHRSEYSEPANQGSGRSHSGSELRLAERPENQ